MAGLVLIAALGCATVPRAKPGPSPLLVEPDLNPAHATAAPRLVQSPQLQSVIAPGPVAIMPVNAEVELYWDPIPDSRAVAYVVYYGRAPRQYQTRVVVGNVTNYQAGGFIAGQTNYFSVTAMDAKGLEGDFSAEALYLVPQTYQVNFRFDQPVSHISIQTGSGLSPWTNCLSWPINGGWRVLAAPGAPQQFYRACGTLQ